MIRRKHRTPYDEVVEHPLPIQIDEQPIQLQSLLPGKWLTGWHILHSGFYYMNFGPTNVNMSMNELMYYIVCKVLKKRRTGRTYN